MLQLKNISKKYVTAGFTQTALDNVSVSFRDSEFVAVLGPSGSGKTTMLNILGGLDHADEGEIVVNGISTKDYHSKDWDTYRNHRVGFIFQSYNLIPHQTILSNVELALTLSGVDRAERKERATRALEEVGLGDHIHKKPSQLSGGQMQRVAIARALVNNPDIVLADEPTGALDTKTGVQIMEILKDVAKDRLVVMVTHNPELAEQYATRIVRLTDGHITDDSDPIVEPIPETSEKPGHSKGRKAGMSFLTALGLSFNNLMTKKGRTFLTAFAGSIGIIGIAAILALSNGVNNYIASTEEQALTSYPLTITKSSFDISSLMTATMGYSSDEGGTDTSDSGDSGDSQTIPESTIMSDMFAQVKNNDLTAFKKYLESGQSDIDKYVNTIQYDYGITPQVYMADTAKNGVERLNPSSMSTTFMTSSASSMSSLGGGSMSSGSFKEMLNNEDVLQNTMDVVEGRWPQNYDEAVLVLDSNGKISDYTLYNLGYYDPENMKQMTQDVLNGKDVTVPEVDRDFTYDDALNMHFKVVPQSYLYQKNSKTGTWTDMSDDDAFMKDQIDNKAIDLKIVGVVKPSETATTPALREGVAYLPSLSTQLIDMAADTDIVKQQLENPDVDVFTGKTFEELQDEKGSSFDMSSMFSVDQAAMSKALGFDSSALSGLSSLGSSASPTLDANALQNIFSEDTMRQMMANAPKFDAQSALANANVTLTDEQSQQLNSGMQQLMAAYSAWAIAHPDAAASSDGMQQFMQTAEAQQIVSTLNTELGPTISSAVNSVMEDYLTNKFAPYLSTTMGNLMQQAAAEMATQMQSQLSGLSSLSSLQNSFKFDPAAFANAIKLNVTQDDLTSLMMNYMNSDELTYDSDLKKLGYASLDNPESISIYPIDFPSKESIISIIDDYNKQMQDSGNDSATIQYSDIAGTLMSSVTSIVNTISLVLIAFVAISLVVSSIMIAIITYISVLERKKEIGILRAMGASKLNIANVFNAETIIEGLIAGVFAIAVVVAASFPVNAFVLAGWKVPNVMSLPWTAGLALIGISVLLTFIAGLIPSSMASRRDPVEALRSE
ncbi:MAG: ATP-binding cassette domain-containing protein [Coriobacteriales bacterium]